MSFFSFGSIFEFIIIFSIIKALYKHFGKGKSETLDKTITKFVTTVKDEINGTKSSTTKPSTPTYPTKLGESKENVDFVATGSKLEKNHNALDLYKSGLITKEEYRKIK